VFGSKLLDNKKRNPGFRRHVLKKTFKGFKSSGRCQRSDHELACVTHLQAG